MSVFSAENLYKNLGGQDVLRGVSLRVEKGEVVAVIGPSGSGKSTLLRCAALLERVENGTIRYSDDTVCTDGRDAAVYASAAELRQIKHRFGMVFQSYNLFPHFSVLRNLTDAPVAVRKMPREQAQERAGALLARFGLSEKSAAYPGTLSGGERQRVSIARALMQDPEIVFFDEPTSALDPELTSEVLRAIRDLAAKKTTMVIVTHEIEFARNVADRVIFMENGAIVEQGIAKEVIDSPRERRTREFLTAFTA